MDFYSAVQGCEALKSYMNTLAVSLSCNESPGSIVEEPTPIKENENPNTSMVSDVMEISMDMSMNMSANMSMSMSANMSMEGKSEDVSQIEENEKEASVR